MANANDDSAHSSPERLRESGSDKSLVGKLVSGLLSNTPLSKWFSNKEEETSRPTVRRRSEDEEDTYALQPPTKRPKLPTEMTSTPTLSSNSVNSIVGGGFPQPVAGPSGIKSRKLVTINNTFAPEFPPTSTFNSQNAANASDDSDSEESEVGFNPVIAHKGEVQEKDLSSTVSLNHSSFNTRSLFSSSQDNNNSRSTLMDKNQSAQFNTSLSSRRPTFNASMFGSPNFVDRTLSTKRIMNSPFYSGNTTYGGASAYTSRLGRSITESSPFRNSVQIKPVNNQKKSLSENNISLSKTARRILNTLEQYSTPVSDAKKIPVSPQRKEQRREGILSRYIGTNPYIIRDGGKAASKRELQVPSVPELLQLKQKVRLQHSTESVRQIALNSNSALNKAEEYTLKPDDDKQQQQTKHTNKMKNNMFSVRKKPQQYMETVAEVNLPKVSLPITTLPKFDLVKEPPKPAELKVTTIGEHKKSEEDGGKRAYQFSSPLVISGTSSKTVPAINCFKFSEPVNKKSKQGDSATTTPIKTKNNGEKVKATTADLFDKFKPAKGTWECSACLVRNDADKAKCVACETPRSSPVAPAPVNAAAPVRALSPLFKSTTSNKWECQTCLVRNDNTSNTCVACTAAKPGSVINKVQSGFDSKFLPSKSTWECAACMIRNKNELSKCAACETPNPAATNSTISSASNDTWKCDSCTSNNKNDLEKCVKCGAAAKTSPKVTFGFGDKHKAPSNTWECPTCMIRNKDELNKCVACETAKPGAQLSSAATATKSLPTFTFGIKPAQSQSTEDKEWECSSCLVRNKSATIACVCCGVPKPGSSNAEIADSKKPVLTFNFGISTGTESFKFGIPPPTTKSDAPSAAPISFGVAAAAANPAPSGSFSFGIKTQTEATASTVNATPTASNPLLRPEEKLPEKVEPAPINVGFKFGTSDSSEKPDTLQKPVATAAPISIALSSSKLNFDFKPAVNGDVAKSNDLSVKPKAQTDSTTAGFKFAPASTATTSASLLTAPPTSKFNVGPPKTDMSVTNGLNVKPAAPTFAFSSGGSSSLPVPENKPFTFSDSGSVNKSNAAAPPPPTAPVAFKFGPPETASTPKTSSGSGFNFSFTSAPNVGFNFGPAKNEAQSSSSNPYGSSAPSVAKNGSFNFGTVANSNQKAIFTFGAGQTNQQQNSCEQGTAPNQVAAFSFGPTTASAAPTPPPGGFNFSATPSFSFTDGTGSSAQQQRKIKRAVRRTHR